MALTMGSLFELNVKVAAAFVPVTDMNSFSKSSDRDTTTYPVFQRALPHAGVGSRTQSYDIGGYLNPTDPGQLALFAAEAADTAIEIEVRWDGTNGFTQMVKVSSYSVDVDPESPEEIGFEFTADAAAVIVGTGPIL